MVVSGCTHHPMAKLENLKTPPVKKGKHGGARAGSGREKIAEKTAVKKMQELIIEHGLEVVTETIRDKVVRKARTLIVLDNLYHLAKDRDNVPAVKEYLDRQVGKPHQTIENNNFEHKTPDLVSEGRKRSKEYLAEEALEEDDDEDEA